MYVNQPYDSQLGTTLISEIDSNTYDSLSIIVAYAKLSGVYRIEPSLKEFKSKGGKIKCVVGIDQKNTTFEALERLNSLADELYIFHSEIYTQTFHPKCYWLSSSENLWFAVGSNNLTAGGLFSNYEMSYCAKLNGNEALTQLSHLNDIMNRYTDTSSDCCQKVNSELIDELYSNCYIEKELEQKKKLITNQRTTIGQNIKKLFGREVFKAPVLVKNKRNHTTPNATSTVSHVIAPTPVSSNASDKEYLIRLVPKAGGRSKQVHFTIDLLNNFFMLKQGDPIILQEVRADGSVAHIENHHIVFSQKNRNVKIEINGASILDTCYPTDITKRPVLIVKHISNNFFTYTLLLDGNPGYNAINSRLSGLPTSRSLPNELIDETTMLSLWPTCPIV